MFGFERVPTDGAYRSLVDWLVRTSSTAVLVIRSEIEVSEQAKHALAKLKPHLVKVEMASEWPGTSLLDGHAEVMHYQTGDLFGALLKKVSRTLYDWQQPDLPEDLCFLRPDGSTLLFSVSHESEAYMNLSVEELISLQEAVPELELRRVSV